MSYEDIQIVRSLPVINGFVRIPEAQATNRHEMSLDEAIAFGFDYIRLDRKGGHISGGGKLGSDEFVYSGGVGISEVDNLLNDAKDFIDVPFWRFEFVQDDIVAEDINFELYACGVLTSSVSNPELFRINGDSFPAGGFTVNPDQSIIVRVYVETDCDSASVRAFDGTEWGPWISIL